MKSKCLNCKADIQLDNMISANKGRPGKRPPTTTKNRMEGFCSSHCASLYNQRKRDGRKRWHGKSLVRLVAQLAKRDGGMQCKYCGLSLLNGELIQIDHQVPKARGGTDEIENLALSCRYCNFAKHDLLPLEYMRWINWLKNGGIGTML